MPLPSPIHATCLAHLILLDFITCTIVGEEYRSLSSLELLTAVLIKSQMSISEHYSWQAVNK
jgi:hypothetical protein